MQQIITTLVCDKCGLEDGGKVKVTTHRITVDGRQREIDACVSCWPSTTLDKLLSIGRTVGRRTRKRAA